MIKVFLRVLRQSSQQLKRKRPSLYLFEWLPREVTGLSATGGLFLAVGIKPLLPLHQSQPLN